MIENVFQELEVESYSSFSLHGNCVRLQLRFISVFSKVELVLVAIAPITRTKSAILTSSLAPLVKFFKMKTIHWII